MTDQLDTGVESDLNPFWMPFTANQKFKAKPYLLESAEGMYYQSPEGKVLLDGTSGLWCVNAGHGRKEIREAVLSQMEKLDYASCFNIGHPLPFEFAQRLIKHTPGDLDHVFFTNSGSESVDTALKIALAYQRTRGEGTRQRLIGREKGYHGVGFGGMSVGGITSMRTQFGTPLQADHLPHTVNIEKNAFTRGMPTEGIHLADSLEDIVAFHDASNIAAVIVEPIGGGGGVLIPPEGYLQRLREICDKHGILLIFDEVITGFGRVGDSFASKRFGVVPDIMTTAKGLTNGNIPMGAVFVSKKIYDTFMTGSEAGIELFHGYTYSGHPVACAAGMATLSIYEDEGLFNRAAELESYWEDAAHQLKGLPHVKDIRNFGLIAGIELESRPDNAGALGHEVFEKCFEKGVVIRFMGDIMAFSPPLIIAKSQIDQLFETLGSVLRELN
ncbi:MAG: aspartate aminotransferase family protein [SAR324 cluster bacterium]|nr:aspartate aminotransferase family protein [SAR324 cluster bacterium]